MIFMKILIIEDDYQTIDALKNFLSLTYAVDTSTNGINGVKKALISNYDLIILDLNLPDMGGEDICKKLRKEEVQTPILVLTGESSTESIVSLLNNGADDYLIKPFSIRELTARVRSLIRRNKKVKKNTLDINGLSIDLNTKEVSFHGKKIGLSKKEYMLLRYLIHNHGKPISRLELFEHLWEGERFFESNIIAVHIFNIRKKLNKKDIIKTVHGLGYKV